MNQIGYRKMMVVRLCITNFLIATLSPVAAADSGRFRHDIRDSLGVNIHFTDPKPGEMRELTGAGMGWIRMDLDWGATERKIGEYNFTHYDTLLDNLKKNRMHAVLILDYRNSLYGSGGVPPFDDSGRKAFARWSVAAVHHFRGHGVLWEMWNEPNNSGFWANPSAAEYAKLALVVGKAIHDAFPDELQIGPATSLIDMPYLETCFQAGCLKYWDAVSVHPYRQTAPETSAPEYSTLKDLIAKYAPAGKSVPILSGEWGYSTAWGGQSNERQGLYLAREFLSNIENGIPLSIWYDWHDDGPDLKDSESNFGMTLNAYDSTAENVYIPKEAYIACKTLTSLLGDYQFTGKVPVSDTANDHVLIFEYRGQKRYAAWTVSGTPHTVNIPTREHSVKVVGWLGGNVQTVQVPSSGLDITVSESPQYVGTGHMLGH